MRFLIILAIIAFFIFLLRRLFQPPRHSDNGQTGQKQAPEKMVECAHCKLYLPRSEAIGERNHFFCSREHYRHWQHQQTND